MKNNEPAIKITQADLELINEIFAFEGAEPLSEALVSKLIQLGWKQSIFDEIQKTAPRCEHGGVFAYYSKKRNSILFAGEEQPDSLTTVEIEKNGTVHFHGLPSFSPF